MLNKIIHFSLQNRILVLVASVLLLIGGTYTAFHTEVDVFPRFECADCSDYDRSEWYGRRRGGTIGNLSCRNCRERCDPCAPGAFIFHQWLFRCVGGI